MHEIGVGLETGLGIGLGVGVGVGVGLDKSYLLVKSNIFSFSNV